MEEKNQGSMVQLFTFFRIEQVEYKERMAIYNKQMMCDVTLFANVGNCNSIAALIMNSKSFSFFQEGMDVLLGCHAPCHTCFNIVAIKWDVEHIESLMTLEEIIKTLQIQGKRAILIWGHQLSLTRSYVRSEL